MVDDSAMTRAGVVEAARTLRCGGDTGGIGGRCHPPVARNQRARNAPGVGCMHLREVPIMDRTMKAAVVRGFGKPLVIEEVAVPRPGPGELLVKIEACGVCHTDLHAAEGDWPVKPTPPFIPGHEGVGHVVAVGDGVSHVREGDRVGIPWLYSACGHCVHCLGGWETLCEQQQNTGYSVNGSFAQYALADAGYVGHLPKEIGFVEIAPVLCAGVTVYKGLKVTDTRPGEWVVISGIGGLGHMAVQYAKAMGLNVAAVDVDDEKLALARRLGATVTVNARTTDPAAFLKKEIGGAHGALVTAVSPKAFEQAQGMMRRGGTVSLVGLPPGSFPLDIFGMVLNGITVRGSIVGTRLDLQESLEFAAQGKVAATVATDRLENINGVFERMREGTIEGRIVLDMAA
jgi:propanol-preferring alcohol dehydrogenase